MEDETSLFIEKTDVVVLFQHRQQSSVFFKLNIYFPVVVVVFQIASKLLTSVSACYGISNVFYLKKAAFQLKKIDLLKTHFFLRKEKSSLKSSLFSAPGSCSNYGTAVHITLKVLYNNPPGMANAEF